MRIRRAPALILTCLLASVILFPFIYAFLASFFTAGDFSTIPAPLLPSSWSLRNYTAIASNRYFPAYVANSVITGLLSAAVRMVLSVLSAYAFSFFRFKGRRILLSLILLTLFIPSDLLLSGNYMTIQHLGLLDSYLGIISTSLLPASQILMLRQYYCSIPSSIHDSALMDGCGDGRFIISILIPLSRAVAGAFFLQSFTSMFNSYLWPLLVTNRNSMRTVQVGITMLGFADGGEYGAEFAAITLIVLPFLVLLGIGKKHISGYLTSGVNR